jgi:hypothetical protein
MSNSTLFYDEFVVDFKPKWFKIEIKPSFYKVKMATKINQILTEWIPGDVHSLRWFEERDVSQNVAYEYYKRGVLEKLGPGIYSRKGEKAKWAGGVRLLQEELGKTIYVAGRTALELQGHAHYILLGNRPVVYLTSYKKEKIPKWFTEIDFSCEFKFSTSTLFSNEMELSKYKEESGLSFKLSCRELAILELISILDFDNSFETAENYLNGLSTIRPDLLQRLLVNCNSVKVKRVFLYLSEKLNLPYFKKLKLDKIDLGKGKRQVIVENAQLDKKYQITVPRDYGENPF